MKAVPDTNVLIDFFRNPNRREEFEAKTLRPQFFMSPVVALELFAGCRLQRPEQRAGVDPQGLNRIGIDAFPAHGFIRELSTRSLPRRKYPST
jgi:predicted nucleic acid-binding protein